MSAAAAMVVGYDPLLRDKTYQQTRLGRDVADFLAWLELGGASPRTLDQYERDLAGGALMFPQKGIVDLGDADMLHIARSFTRRQKHHKAGQGARSQLPRVAAHARKPANKSVGGRVNLSAADGRFVPAQGAFIGADRIRTGVSALSAEILYVARTGGEAA